jgi:phosphoglycolate phosphatase
MGNLPSIMTIFRRKSSCAFCVSCLTATTRSGGRGQFSVPGGGRYARRAACKGLPLALVTNKPTPFVAPLLDALDIAKYFTVVIGGDDVKKSRIRNRCCWWRKSSGAAELLFVGDSRNDIQA